MLKNLLRVLNQIYQFFAGDAILLGGVAVAFGSAAVLSRIVSNLVEAVVFVSFIVAGLTVTLAREVYGRPKP
jgi:uncharacterized membrane protein YccC